SLSRSRWRSASNSSRAASAPSPSAASTTSSPPRTSRPRTNSTLRASTALPPALAMVTFTGCFAAAWVKIVAGRACRPTDEPTLTLRSGTGTPFDEGCGWADCGPAAWTKSSGRSDGRGGLGRRDLVRRLLRCAVEALERDHQEGSHDGTDEDRQQVEERVADQRHHEDATVRRPRRAPERHAQPTGHRRPRHQRRDHP